MTDSEVEQRQLHRTVNNGFVFCHQIQELNVVLEVFLIGFREDGLNSSFVP